MVRLSAGCSESNRLARAQGSGRKVVAVVDADVVFFCILSPGWFFFETGNSKFVWRRRAGLLCETLV